MINIKANINNENDIKKRNIKKTLKDENSSNKENLKPLEHSKEAGRKTRSGKENKIIIPSKLDEGKKGLRENRVLRKHI